MWRDLEKLHAHSVRTMWFFGTELAYPRYFSGAGEKRRSLDDGDFESNDGVDGMGIAAGQENAPPSHVGCESLDEGGLVRVAKLNSDKRSFWRRHGDESIEWQGAWVNPPESFLTAPS